MNLESKFIRARIENAYIDFICDKYFVRFDIVIDSGHARGFNVYFSDEYGFTQQFIVNVPSTGRGSFSQEIFRNPGDVAKLQIEYLPKSAIEVLDIAEVNPHGTTAKPQKDKSNPISSWGSDRTEGESGDNSTRPDPVIPRPSEDCRNGDKLRVYYEGADSPVTGSMELCLYNSMTGMCSSPGPISEISAGVHPDGYIEFNVAPFHEQSDVYYMYQLEDSTLTPWVHGSANGGRGASWPPTDC